MLGRAAEHLGAAEHLVAKGIDQDGSYFVAHLSLQFIGLPIEIERRSAVAAQGAG